MINLPLECQILENSLRVIAYGFHSVESLREQDDGLEYWERLEMAYENMQYEAKYALDKVTEVRNK